MTARARDRRQPGGALAGRGRAARRERAAGDGGGQVRRAAGDGGQLRLALGLEAQHRVEQGGGVPVPGRVEDLGRGPGLGLPARVHDEHPVGMAGDHAHVVGDQQGGHAERLAQPVEQLHDLRLGGDVQGGGRLVGDQQPGLGTPARRR